MAYEGLDDVLKRIGVPQPGAFPGSSAGTDAPARKGRTARRGGGRRRKARTAREPKARASKASSGSKTGERFATALGKQAVATAIGRGLTSKAARKSRSSAIRTGISAASSKVGRGFAKVKAVGQAGAFTGGAKAVIGKLGLAAAAGVASYKATSYVLQRIKDRKERKAQELFERAQAYRLARADAKRRLGRNLRPAELALLAQQFKSGVP